MFNAEGTLIGLDLGTSTGMASLVLNGPKPNALKLRLLELAKESELRAARKANKDALRFHDIRVSTLWTILNEEIKHLPEPVWVAFEDVRFAKSLAQAQLWSSYRGALWTLPVHRSRFFSVPTSTLKSYAGACGNGKDAMQAALKRRMRLTTTDWLDDNIVDAAWVLLWAADTQFGLTLDTIL